MSPQSLDVLYISKNFSSSEKILRMLIFPSFEMKILYGFSKKNVPFIADRRLNWKIFAGKNLDFH